MPTYEYVCRDCGKHLEVVQSFRDAALTTCPACAGSLRKVFGAAGIIFKGSGYYVTDSRKPPPGSKVAAASKDGGKASGTDTAETGSAKDSAGDTAGEASASAKSA
jgi:putative FmdB family regulatory protein